MTPNDPYMGRTAPLTSKRCILYIYSTNVGTEYFKHALYSPVFSLQNAVCFIMLTCLVPVLFTFYIQDVLKIKKNISGAKGLSIGGQEVLQIWGNLLIFWSALEDNRQGVVLKIWYKKGSVLQIVTQRLEIWIYLTLILLTWRIGWAHNNASKYRIGRWDVFVTVHPWYNYINNQLVATVTVATSWLFMLLADGI